MFDSNVILKELKNIGEGLPLHPDILRCAQDDNREAIKQSIVERGV
jgi:hypothetical protein